jgi:feruloyl esterase
VRGAGNPGGANADLPKDWPATRTRPLCPWPQAARFRGIGNPERAEEFDCR